MSLANPAPGRPSYAPAADPVGRVAVILNDGAGSAQDAAVRTITGVLDASGVDARIDAVPGARVRDAAERAVRDGFSIVAAAGGDGTLNAVASVVAGSEATLGV